MYSISDNGGNRGGWGEGGLKGGGGGGWIYVNEGLLWIFSYFDNVSWLKHLVEVTRVSGSSNGCNTTEPRV